MYYILIFAQPRKGYTYQHNFRLKSRGGCSRIKAIWCKIVITLPNYFFLCFHHSNYRQIEISYWCWIQLRGEIQYTEYSPNCSMNNYLVAMFDSNLYIRMVRFLITILSNLNILGLHSSKLSRGQLLHFEHL